MKTQKEIDHTFYLKHREERIQKATLWAINNPERKNVINRKAMKKMLAMLRSEILFLLGGKCVICGFNDERALQIDHVNGKGNQEHSCFKNQTSYYRYVLGKIKEGSKDYQCLCANHNWIKKFEEKETKEKYL